MTGAGMPTLSSSIVGWDNFCQGKNKKPRQDGVHVMPRLIAQREHERYRCPRRLLPFLFSLSLLRFLSFTHLVSPPFLLTSLFLASFSSKFRITSHSAAASLNDCITTNCRNAHNPIKVRRSLSHTQVLVLTAYGPTQAQKKPGIPDTDIRTPSSSHLPQRRHGHGQRQRSNPG